MIAKVVEKFILELEVQLSDRNVIIDVSPKVTQWLVEKGYDPLMGARPLARVIQEHIKKPLADQLLFGDLTKGGIAKINLDKDDKITIAVTAGENVALEKPKAREKVKN